MDAEMDVVKMPSARGSPLDVNAVVTTLRESPIENVIPGRVKMMPPSALVGVGVQDPTVPPAWVVWVTMISKTEEDGMFVVEM